MNLERFWSHVEKSDDCWLWTGSMSPTGGRYGHHGYPKYGGRSAHRLSYEMQVGPIPAGLELDHLCRQPRCVNPAHLEPVTRAENIARHVRTKTECVNGHPFDAANTYMFGNVRTCRACNRAAQKRRRDQ